MDDAGWLLMELMKEGSYAEHAVSNNGLGQNPEGENSHRRRPSEANEMVDVGERILPEDGWAEMISSLEHFDNEGYGIRLTS